MENIDYGMFLLFLLGAITVLLAILAFFVPILLLGIYRNSRDIKGILKKEKGYLEHESVSGQKLHDIFLSMDAEIDREKKTNDKTAERSGTIS